MTIVAGRRNDYMELIRKLTDRKYIVSSANKNKKIKTEKPQQDDDDCCVNLINTHKVENISQENNNDKSLVNCPDVITQDISNIQECFETISQNITNNNNSNNRNDEIDNIFKQLQNATNDRNPLYVQQLKQQDQMARSNVLDLKLNVNPKTSSHTDTFAADKESNNTQPSSQRSASNDGRATASFKVEKTFEDDDDNETSQQEQEVSEETGVTVRVALTTGTLSSLMAALPRVLGDLGLPYRDPYGWTVIDKTTGVLISNPRTKSGSGDFRDPREVKLPRDILCIELLPTQNTLLNYNKAERQEEFLLSNNIQLPNGTTTLNKAFTFGDALPLDIDEMPMWSPDERIAVLVSNATGKPHGSRCQIPTSSISTMNIFVTSLFSPATIKRERMCDQLAVCNSMSPVEELRLLKRALCLNGNSLCTDTSDDDDDDDTNGFDDIADYYDEFIRYSQTSKLVFSGGLIDASNYRFSSYFALSNLQERMNYHYTKSSYRYIIDKFPNNEVDSLITDFSLGILSGLGIEWHEGMKNISSYKEKVKNMATIAKSNKDTIVDCTVENAEKVTIEKKKRGRKKLCKESVNTETQNNNNSNQVQTIMDDKADVSSTPVNKTIPAKRKRDEPSPSQKPMSVEVKRSATEQPEEKKDKNTNNTPKTSSNNNTNQEKCDGAARREEG